jgi:hypothetical protein
VAVNLTGLATPTTVALNNGFIAIGPGACSATTSVGTVTTSGPGSPGVTSTSPGPINITDGNVTTTGPSSPGVVATGGSGPININSGTVSTSGSNSPGISATGTGPINVTSGSVTTSGDNSNGIQIAGGSGPVIVNSGSVMTSGQNSSGIVVTTTTGDQTIVSGPVMVTGPGSDGIDSTATGCANVSITANGPISSAQGYGINASSACKVTVITNAGAPVSGALAGINVTSGTGATVTIGDRLSSSGGPALAIAGAPAVVTIQSGGDVVGRIALTSTGNTVTNNGRIDALGDSSFGAGAGNTLTNTGVIAIRPGQTAPGSVKFTGLTSTINAGGLIDLRNGQVGDTLTLSGTFIGTGASRLGLDVNLTQPGAADRLIVTGAATGSTAISINQLTQGTGLLTNGLVVVQGGAGASASAFTLAGGSVTNGLVTYSLAFNAANNSFALFGTPSMSAYEIEKVQEGARQTFYQTNDAISSHIDSLNDPGASTAGGDPVRYSALWAVFYGNDNTYNRNQTMSAFGQTSTMGFAYGDRMFGGQFGYDRRFGRSLLLGLTGGFDENILRFSANNDKFSYRGGNIGAYGQWRSGPIFMNVIGRYEHYSLQIDSYSAGFTAKPNGDTWGGKAEIGAYFGSRLYVEPHASIEYVRSSTDSFTALNSTFAFSDGEGTRGRVGLRVGSLLVQGPSVLRFYLGADAVRELSGSDRVSFTNNGQTVPFLNPRMGSYVQAKIGGSYEIGPRLRGYVEGIEDFGSHYSGIGAKVGISFKF